jgi:hypothetical protein
MDRSDRHDWDGARLVLAFVLAPAVPAAFIGVGAYFEAAADADRLGNAVMAFFVVLLLGGWLPSALIGLPLLKITDGLPPLRTPLAVTLGGAMVALLPQMAITTMARASGDLTVNEGLSILLLAVPGAVGGIVFWAIAFWRPRRAAPANAS